MEGNIQPYGKSVEDREKNINFTPTVVLKFIFEFPVLFFLSKLNGSGRNSDIQKSCYNRQ